MIVLFESGKKYSDEEMIEMMLVKDYPLVLVKQMQRYGLEVVDSDTTLAKLVAKSSSDKLWFKDADYYVIYDFYKNHYEASKKVVIVSPSIIVSDFEEVHKNELLEGGEKRVKVVIDKTSPSGYLLKFSYDFIIDNTGTVFRFRRVPVYSKHDKIFKSFLEAKIDYDLEDFDIEHI